MRAGLWRRSSANRDGRRQIGPTIRAALTMPIRGGRGTAVELVSSIRGHRNNRAVIYWQGTPYDRVRFIIAFAACLCPDSTRRKATLGISQLAPLRRGSF